MLPLPALVAKWQTRTLEVRVEKSMGVRVSPSALYLISEIYISARLGLWNMAQIGHSDESGSFLRLHPTRATIAASASSHSLTDKATVF